MLNVYDAVFDYPQIRQIPQSNTIIKYKYIFQLQIQIQIHRGAATGGTYPHVPPPTLKSRGTSYVLVPPPLLPHN